ncbi:hypothetical protein FOA52_001835 [Chlamydomonas sp. UWO 241]|nr:hypothetical protein FOA52_001835 [Chlamydomonas sp. UWO 241]
MLSSEQRKLMRGVVKLVHPDLFPEHEYERTMNSESLKVLNRYVEELTNRRSPKASRVEFYIKGANGEGELKKVAAHLGTSGSLSPLFVAFGLTDTASDSDDERAPADVDFLLWLRDCVSQAVGTADKHEKLKLNIRQMRRLLEEAFGITSVQVGAEYASSIGEQEKQLEALTTMQDVLQTTPDLSLDGVSVQLYPPALSPQESTAFVDENGMFSMRTEYMRAYVADDGCVHVVAQRETMAKQLRGLDLSHARTLTTVTHFWARRMREVTSPVTELLGVRSVWCDAKSESASQKFVLWAGYLLEQRAKVESVLDGRQQFSFSVIVSVDSDAPLISTHPSSPVLNVSADCPAAHLLEFLASEAGSGASNDAAEVHAVRAREEALLEDVRVALDAKVVIKICMNDRVNDGARRLLENAHIIRQTVDLSGACIALDDCYEVWDSGFISIPYDFSVGELPAMVRMLQAGQRPGDLTQEARAAAVATQGAGAAAGDGGGSPVGTRAFRAAGVSGRGAGEASGTSAGRRRATAVHAAAAAAAASRVRCSSSRRPPCGSRPRVFA